MNPVPPVTSIVLTAAPAVARALPRPHSHCAQDRSIKRGALRHSIVGRDIVFILAFYILSTSDFRDHSQQPPTLRRFPFQATRIFRLSYRWRRSLQNRSPPVDEHGVPTKMC